ncbi:hypothetical protein F52700_2466 [Fusarium sp. NRRL 52700]|nr:hypothetical protein F52700_2466 [Fusarium sp. NRRL 52700]
MPEKTRWQKEMARKGYEERQARRPANEDSISRPQGHNRQSGAGHGNMSPDTHTNSITTGPSLASRHGINQSHGQRLVENSRVMCSTPDVPLPAEAALRDRIAEANSRRIKAEAYSSLRQPRKSRAIKAQGDLQSRITKVAKVAEILCAECGSTSHTLKGCITTISGGIRGCIFCNNKSHSTDSCREFEKIGLEAKVKLLVTDRAGMPPIFTDAAWSIWLHRFLMAPHTEGKPIPKAFPWTVEFARHVYGGKAEKSVQEYQKDFDRTQRISVLPRDWRIQSMNDVFINFWNGEGNVWPARLDNPTSSTEANPEANTSSQGDTDTGAPSMDETQRLRDIIIGQAMEIHDWKKKYEELKKENEVLEKENEELKKRLA